MKCIGCVQLILFLNFYLRALYATRMFIRTIIRSTTRNIAVQIVDARQLSEEKRITPGFHEVFGALYKQLHLGQLWSSRYRVSEKVFREAVLMRLAQPGRSKRKHVALLSRDHGIEVSLERFYRMMDHLDEP